MVSGGKCGMSDLKKSTKKKKKSKLNDIYLDVKPILNTYIFELKKNSKKFVIFSIIICLLSFLFLLLTFIPESSLNVTQSDYLQDSLSIIIMVMIFGACFFFGGIICSEFSTKTGYVVFPKINKYKLIIGKYLGNLTLFIGVIGINYIIIGLLSIYFYGTPVPIRFYYSFGISILYILAVSSFVTLFSSFMKSVNMTIVVTILILLIVFSIVDQIIVMIMPDFEPLYSIVYVSNLITSILEVDYPTGAERYTDHVMRGFTFRIWHTPIIVMGIMVLLLYMVICLTLAALIFKRKQI